MSRMVEKVSINSLKLLLQIDAAINNEMNVYFTQLTYKNVS